MKAPQRRPPSLLPSGHLEYRWLEYTRFRGTDSNAYDEFMWRGRRVVRMTVLQGGEPGYDIIEEHRTPWRPDPPHGYGSRKHAVPFRTHPEVPLKLKQYDARDLLIPAVVWPGFAGILLTAAILIGPGAAFGTGIGIGIINGKLFWPLIQKRMK